MCVMMDGIFSSDLVEEFEVIERDYQYTETVDTERITSETTDESEIDDASVDSIDILTQSQESNNEEDKSVNDFVNTTCCCNFGPRKTACSLQLYYELILSSHLNCQEMTKAELDLVVLANLDGNRRCTIDQQRSRVHIQYSFCGNIVCKTTFLFVHSVGTKAFKNLVAHFDENGLTPRMHGNTKRLPPNAISYSTTKDIAQFITNFASIHALPLPGRIPGVYSDEKALLLPSNMSKRHVHREYTKISDNPVSRRKFETLWCELLPKIATMKPATDLCEICQCFIVTITRFGNLPE